MLGKADSGFFTAVSIVFFLQFVGCRILFGKFRPSSARPSRNHNQYFCACISLHGWVDITTGVPMSIEWWLRLFDMMKEDKLHSLPLT